MFDKTWHTWQQYVLFCTIPGMIGTVFDPSEEFQELPNGFTVHIRTGDDNCTFISAY